MGMLFQPSVTPQTLSDLGNVPVGLSLEGIRGVSQAQNADQMQYQDLPSLIAHQQAMRPLDEGHQQIMNDQGLAQLPGLRVDSQMKQTSANETSQLSPYKIKDMISKYGADQVRQDAETGVTHGQLAMQAAAAIDANPMAGMVAAKKLLAQSGIWDDSFDTANPQQLSQKLRQYGTQVVDSATKVQQMIAQAQYKAYAASSLETQKQQGRVALNSMITNRMGELQKAELTYKSQHFAPGLDKLASQYKDMAYRLESSDDEADKARAKTLHAKAEDLAQGAASLRAAGAQVNQEGKIDVGQLGGLPTVDPNRRQPGQPIFPTANGKPHTLGELKQLYPGKSDQELKAAYKQKFGVDPQ